MWARMAAAAARGDAARHEAKIHTARFFAQRVLNQAHALARAVADGSASVVSLPVDQF
jgi:hypothetical protein